MNLKRHKIKGISFHHRTSQKSKRHKSQFQDFFNLNELDQQIKKETPKAFTHFDIRRFLMDHGRNEINAQISLCIDLSTKWNGILKVYERCFPDNFFISSESIANTLDENSNNHFVSQEIELYLGIKKCVWLWKHNLSILEMSAQAQYDMRN